MIGARVLTISLLCAGFGTSLPAIDFSGYRGLQFGMSPATARKQAGTKPAPERTVHQRPALIQEMDWEPATPAITDPVRDGLLCFLNGELFRIVITYDRYKVEGLTADDMIEAISATYGAATKPTAEIAYHSIYGEVAPVLARWEDAQYSFNLVRTGDRSSFAMVLYSKKNEVAAQAAIVEAVRLDTQEAPQRELDKQKKRDDLDRLSRERARSLNKPNFRP